MKYKIIIYLMSLATLFTTNVTLAVAYPENLDELFARKSRHKTSAYQKNLLENSAAGHTWQPGTLQYIDLTTGREVWRMTNGTDLYDIFLEDLSGNIWSADGKRMAFVSSRDTNAYTKTQGQKTWFTMRADGTLPRPIVNGASRYWHTARQWQIPWSPVEPDVYYQVGRPDFSNGTLDREVYKVTVSDLSESREKIFTLPSEYTADMSTLQIDRLGKNAIAMNYAETWMFPLTLYPAPSVNVANGYTTVREIDPYWGSFDTSKSVAPYHGWGISADGQWLEFMPSNPSTNGLGGLNYSVKLLGSATDGGSGAPIIDHTYPYDWEGSSSEFFPRNVTTNSTSVPDPYCGSHKPDGKDCSGYVTHGATDPWGRNIIFTNTERSPLGMNIYDQKNHVWVADRFYNASGGQHHSWNAWSDYPASSGGTYLSVPPGDSCLTLGYPRSDWYAENKVYMMKYDDANSLTPLASAHTLYNNNGGCYNGAGSEYASLARPSQSPDGTKVAFHSSFLNNKGADGYDSAAQGFYVVAYYPHPPEITSVTNNGGTYTVRFDWRTDQSVSRGYTQRGWPNEATDDPPPPRETKLFRLWRSANGTSDWSPVGTVDADIFIRYEFSTGKWIGNKYWEIKDAPGNGVWYYSVTAQEHSGLESRTLSNIISTEGTILKDYPKNPKGDQKFTNKFNHKIVRYFNIYAKDNSTPTTDQKCRIASIPYSSVTSEYIDFLGNQDGSTKYLMTAVDTLGNESSPISTDFTYIQSLNVYKLKLPAFIFPTINLNQ